MTRTLQLHTQRQERLGLSPPALVVLALASTSDDINARWHDDAAATLRAAFPAANVHLNTAFLPADTDPATIPQTLEMIR